MCSCQIIVFSLPSGYAFFPFPFFPVEVAFVFHGPLYPFPSSSGHPVATFLFLLCQLSSLLQHLCFEQDIIPCHRLNLDLLHLLHPHPLLHLKPISTK